MRDRIIQPTHLRQALLHLHQPQTRHFSAPLRTGSRPLQAKQAPELALARDTHLMHNTSLA